MKLDVNSLVFYAVSDSSWTKESTLLQQVHAAIHGGITCLQYRDKDLADHDFLLEALKIQQLCQEHQIPFIINDRVSVAMQCQADGVHIGQNDLPVAMVRQMIGPQKILGVSVQTVEQAREAEANGADYLGVGAVFATSTKKDAEMVSFETLQEICKATSLPVVAIGGITARNLSLLAGSGIAGVALVSAIFAAQNIEKECRNLKEDILLMLQMGTIRKVLTIAGSDCSGGAGIQADIKTITAHKLYAMSVITALTAQNTTGVFGVLDVPADFVAQQLDCVFQDIIPDAIKIGMVSNASTIKCIANKLLCYGYKFLVVDPVMVSTSGNRLISDDALLALTETLLPLSHLITPNIPEAEVLTGMSIQNRSEMEKAGRVLKEQYPADILIKGGHMVSEATDLLITNTGYRWFSTERIATINTHGTGCTLSSAIACHLAMGQSMENSIAAAKEYITGALTYKLNLGKGRGPLNHTFRLG